MAVTVSTMRGVVSLDDSGYQAGAAHVKTTAQALAKTLIQAGSQSADGLKRLEFAATGLDNALKGSADRITNIQKTGTSITSTGNAANKAAGDFNNFSNATKNSDRAVKNLNSDMQSLGGFLQGAGVGMTVAFTAPIVAAGIAASSAAMDMESLELGLNAVTGSAEETQRQLVRLREVAKLPGLSFEDAVRGSINLQSAGFSAALAEKALKAFGNALATVGKGAADLTGVNLAITQLANKTTGFGQDIRQLQERLPQIRQILLKAFNTADTEKIAALGITGKKVAEVIIDEFSKLPPVTGGAKNAVENFNDSMRQSGAAFGKSSLPLIAPILGTIGTAAEGTARIFAELPAPIKLTVVGLLGVVAAAGPVIVIVGTLISSVARVNEAWTAYTALRASVVATAAAEAAAIAEGSLALETQTVVITANRTALGGLSSALGINTVLQTAFNGQIFQGAIVVNSLKSALGLAIPVLLAFTGGYIIGTAINDAFIGSIDRAREAVESETKAHLQSIPYLEKAIDARKRLAALDAQIASSGNPGLKNTKLYREAAQDAAFFSEEYKKAAASMSGSFDSAAAAAKASVEKMKVDFAKAVEKANLELAKLKAPTIEAKLKVEYPKIDEAEIKKLGLIEQQIEATKKLQEAQKKAADDHARSLADFKKQIDDARKEIQGLNSGTTYGKLKASADSSVPDAMIRELATLKDQKDALDASKKVRDEETKKITELTKKIQLMNGVIAQAPGVMSGGAAGGTRSFSTGGGQWQDVVKNIAKEFGLKIVSGFRPGAIVRGTGTPSLHGTGTAQYPGALDVGGGSARQMAEFFSYMKQNFASSLKEMIYTPQGQVHNGKPYANISNPKTAADHYDHVHVAAYTNAVLGATKALGQATPVIKTTATATDALTKSSMDMATALSSGIGPKAAGELIDSTTSLSRQFAVMSAEGLKNKTAIELTGVAYSRLNAVQKALVSQNVALQQSIQKKEDLQRLGEAWNDARVNLLKVTAATAEEKIALELYKKSLSSLSPLEESRIRDIASFNQRAEEATKAQEELKRRTDAMKSSVADSRFAFLEATATTDKARIMLGFYKEQLKDVPDNVGTAQGALFYLSQFLRINTTEAGKAAEATADYNKNLKELGRETTWKEAIADQRAALLNVFSATEQERIALGFFKDKIGELPPEVKTAAQALQFFQEKLGLNVQGAKDAAKQILGYQKALQWTPPTYDLSGFAESMKNLGKSIEDAKKRYNDFRADLTQRNALAGLSIVPAATPAQQAWLEFLARNSQLAKDLAKNATQAAEAQREFTKTFNKESYAEAFNKLRDSQTDATRQLNEAKGATTAYQQALQDLGISADEVTVNMDTMIKKLVETREETKRVQKFKETIQSLASDMQSVFENAFNDLREHGFKGFFDSILTGFQDMLAKMAAQFLASQITNLIMNFIGAAIGAGAGASGGGGASPGLQAGDGGFGGFAASGGPVVAGKRYVVGEQGPEMFVPSSSGRIVPNDKMGGGGTLVYSPTYNISTPDANSFRRSQSQIMDDAGRQIERLRRRNG